MLSFRKLVPADQDKLWHWLHVALWDPPPAPLRPIEILQHPGVRIYAEDWGRAGDVGVVAMVDGVEAGALPRRGAHRRDGGEDSRRPGELGARLGLQVGLAASQGIGEGLVLGGKAERHRIDTVALAGRRRAVGEDVALVAAAAGAHGLDPHHIEAVHGYADTRLRTPSAPLDPGNRRISIFVRRQDAKTAPVADAVPMSTAAPPPAESPAH